MRQGHRPSPHAATFEQLYDETFPWVFAALCLVTGNRHEAEEVARRAFGQVHARWDDAALVEDQRGHLLEVSMGVVRCRYRRTSLGLRRVLRLAPPATDDLAALESHDPALGLLRWLDGEERAMFVVTELLGYSAQAASRMLGVAACADGELTARARARSRPEAIDLEAAGAHAR